MLNSVQICKSRLPDLDPKPVALPGFGKEVLVLRENQYDDFLGCMKGILPLVEAKPVGAIIA